MALLSCAANAVCCFLANVGFQLFQRALELALVQLPRELKPLGVVVPICAGQRSDHLIEGMDQIITQVSCDRLQFLQLLAFDHDGVAEAVTNSAFVYSPPLGSVHRREDAIELRFVLSST